MSTIKRYMFEDRAFDPDYDPNDEETFEFLEDDTPPPPPPMEEAPQRDPIEEQVVVEEPIAPTFSEEEVARAQQSAFDEGKVAGRHEASQEIENTIAQTLQKIGQAVPAGFQALKTAEETNQAQAVSIAQAVLKKILPSYVRKHGADEIINVVMQCLEPLRGEPRLILKVHEDVRDEIFEKVTKIAEDFGFDGRVVVMPSSDLELGDCKVDWSEGGAERDSETLWQEIDGIIEQNLTQGS